MEHNNKEKIAEYYKKYYQENKEKLLIKKKIYLTKSNYRYEKTPNQRKIRYIKRKTRYHFSLNNMKCKICNMYAECRHHTTTPIRFDKFDFLCNKCHYDTHKSISYKEVKN